MKGYGNNARVLSLGVASTGLVTFAYFTVASHILPASPYKSLTLLWSVLFVIVSIIYRPIEQFLARSIADRRARGIDHGHPIGIATLLQFGFALTFLVVALALHNRLIAEVFTSSELYWVLVIGVVAYSASYFARGWLAGHQRFALYGSLLLFESCSRFLFAFAALIGVTHGQTAVAVGMAAAPLFSLVVMPFALSRRRSAISEQSSLEPDIQKPAPDFLLSKTHRPTTKAALSPRQVPLSTPLQGSKREQSFRHSATFTVSVFAIMLAEQAILNVGVLRLATFGALAGFLFNAFLIARAPLQLFQAVQTSLLPHLASLAATGGRAEFHRAIMKTLRVIMVFGGIVALALLTLGPFAMNVLFGHKFDYARGGLALLGLGMGFHLMAATLNQAALARHRAPQAGAAWLLSAGLFVGWLFIPVVQNQILRVESGYAGATLLLTVNLFVIYLLSHRNQS